MEIKTSSLFPSSFNEDFRSVLNSEFTEFCEYGGRGSCKSSFISICIVLLVVTFPFANALIMRKTAKALRNSVYEQIKWAIDKLNLDPLFRCTVSPMQITYKPTGQILLFSGVDEPTRLKSLKVKKGYFAVAWFEESSEFTEAEMHNVKLTVMRGGERFWIFDSFNPPSAVRNWKNLDVRKPKKNRLTRLSDYRTVPRSWLGEAFLFEAEDLKARNERAYKNIFLGEPTGTGSSVFENITLQEITDEQIMSFEWKYYGIDWGYYPDPFVWGATAYDIKKHTLYIYDELQLYKHGNDKASEVLKRHIAGKCQQSDRITADSAEPKSVADFAQWGWNIRGAEKGTGSLDAGFKWLQSLKNIVIDPKRCPHAADEFSLYEYEIDKRTGEVLSGYPQGQPDHFMALTRYALESVWKRRGL